MARPRVVTFAVARAALGINQRANIVEAIRGDHSRSDELPQRGFHFGFDFSGSAHDVREKRSATLAQMREHVARGGLSPAVSSLSPISDRAAKSSTPHLRE